MSQFLLLLYENNAALRSLSPEEMQKAFEKYMAWSQKPFTKGGKRLAEDYGRILHPDKGHANGGKSRVTDGPYSEAKEVLGGFYLIEADSYDHAVELTQGHPHLEYGGVIEVRQIFGT
ncbi:MAG TPA: YciI family protein [Bryobacteraceae bacterium]|jgi:hypothetical protein